MANALAAVTPVRVKRGGHLVPCEPVWRIGRNERTRIVVAMLRDGETDSFIRANVPGARMGTATLAKIKAQAERAGVTGPPAFFDATSGANPEAHRRLLAILAG